MTRFATTRLRGILRAFWFIHLLVLLGLAALVGVLTSDSKHYLIFFVVLSFAGAACGAFIRVIDVAAGRLQPRT